MVFGFRLVLSNESSAQRKKKDTSFHGPKGKSLCSEGNDGLPFFFAQFYRPLNVIRSLVISYGTGVRFARGGALITFTPTVLDIVITVPADGISTFRMGGARLVSRGR